MFLNVWLLLGLTRAFGIPIDFKDVEDVTSLDNKFRDRGLCTQAKSNAPSHSSPMRWRIVWRHTRYANDLDLDASRRVRCCVHKSAQPQIYTSTSIYIYIRLSQNSLLRARPAWLSNRVVKLLYVMLCSATAEWFAIRDDVDVDRDASALRRRRPLCGADMTCGGRAPRAGNHENTVKHNHQPPHQRYGATTRQADHKLALSDPV